MKLFRVVAVAALMLLVIAGPRPASAQTSSGACPTTSGTQYPPQNCSVAADRTQVRPGESITVSGQCPSGATSVTFRLVPGNADLGAVTPAANGSYSRSVTIPSGTAPGDYELQARCEGVQGAGVVRSIAITVVAATTATTAAATAGSTLPRTGSEGLPTLALTATALVAIGAVAVVAARRKRPAA